MFGYRIHQWGTTPIWEEIADPTPGPGEVAIEVEACGVGRTVLNCINGDLNDGRASLPRVPGHELVGRVTGLGGDAPTDLLGRRVVGYFYLICGVCASCTQGREPWCEQLGGFLGVHRDGGYAPRVVLPARNALPLPESLDPVAATVVADAVATPVHVANRAGIEAHDRVVVIGAGGGVGIHMIQVAAARGAVVVGLDVGAEKLAAVERNGALAVDSSHFEEMDADELFPAGPPTVIVDLVGTDDSTRWGLEALGMGGRFVVLTTFPDRFHNFAPRRLVFREGAVLGSRYASRTEVIEAARLVARGDVTPVIGTVRGPADVLDIHEQLNAGSLIGRGALDWRRA